MQPDQPLPSDIVTLADWIYKQFKPTDPIEVQNILPEPYFFRYCVGEEIATPDAVSRQVLDRKYEEFTLEPGESKVLMGGAAYIFVDGVARQYVFKTEGADATGDLARLVKAASRAIIGNVGYSRNAAQDATAPAKPTNQVPPAIATDLPIVGTETTTTVDEDENVSGDAFDNLNDESRFEVIPPADKNGKARFLVDGNEVTQDEYNEARNAAATV